MRKLDLQLFAGEIGDLNPSTPAEDVQSISKINVGGQDYNIEDTTAREGLSNKQDKKPDGTHELIDNNKISTTYIPDYILGQLIYGGTVTGVGVATLSTNAKSKLGTTSTSITLTNNTTAITGYVANEGIYYVVSSDGSFASLSLKTGDWLISTGSAWKKIDNTDEVTSVQISATSPVTSSTSSSQTGSVSTTISLENNYGDTQNPYGNKSKNLVLASPSTTTGSPSFRSLVEDDIPSLSESKITNLTTDLAGKQETLVSGTNIKTINNTSLLGSGNISVTTSVKTLNTTNTTAQSTNSSEAISGSGTVNLHKISKTGTYTDLIKKPTDTYDTSSTYNSGDVCIYNGNMYKCNTNSTTGTWDSTKWDAIISGGSGPSFVNGVVGANNDVEGIKVYDSLYPSQSTVYGNSIKNTRNNVDCYINLPFHDFNNTGNTLTTVECTYKAESLVYDISTGSFSSGGFGFDSDYAEDLMELINDYNSIYFSITDEYWEEKYYTLRASEMVPDDESSPTSYTIYATGIASNKENSSLLSGPIQATLIFEREYDSTSGEYYFNLNVSSSSLTQLGGGGGTTVTFVDWS